jgi:Ca2+-binding RTX toxin-like protein
LSRFPAVPGLVIVLMAAVPATARAGTVPTCFGQKATIVGTKGADRITLTPAHDVVVSLAGDDTIVPEFYSPDDGSESDPYVYAGPSPSRDLVCTGDGNDTIIGDQGSAGYAYKVDAGTGADRIGSGTVIYAGRGKDVVSYLDCSPTKVHGGPGDDVIISGHSAYAEEGDPGPRGDRSPDDDDTIWGDGGNDRIFGADGDDVIYGGPGNDDIHGGTGNNRLYGWAGSDTLRGDTGNDLLDGGGESGDIDRCGGGLGKNTYAKCERRIPGDHES